MKRVNRRTFLKTSFVGTCAPAILRATQAGDRNVRIVNIKVSYRDYKYRVPIKFGGVIGDRVTLMDVHSVISSRNGKSAEGFGSMPLGNIWSFPSRIVPYDVTLSAMKNLAARISNLMRDYKEYGHPIDLNWGLEPMFLKAAAEVSHQMNLAEPIPKLCTIVTASPFDAAIHDAYGKLYGVNCYHTYGPEFMPHDLSQYLGPEYQGKYPQDYILKEPRPKLPLYHLVSAIDPLTDADIQHRVNDGLPETLAEWINYNGLTHLKIKLDGDDLKWDSDRVLGVDRIATETEKKRGVKDWVYSLDFNERCPNVQYLVDFLNRVKEKTPEGFARIQYVEQPTARDLETHRQNTVFEAAKLKPVVIDESLTGVDALMLSREMGYTGAALKACKGQSASMIIASVAEKNKMFLCVQDLTCPGASLIQSASLAAHVPGVKAIEANARQFVPAANAGWEKRFPGVFHITDGMMVTAHLNGPGIGAV
jgi:L-alanine-DL-glutamate epimerase-like enolase superfamily enzyme